MLRVLVLTSGGNKAILARSWTGKWMRKWQGRTEQVVLSTGNRIRNGTVFHMGLVNLSVRKILDVNP